jgi:hypothetical protein
MMTQTVTMKDLAPNDYRLNEDKGPGLESGKK